MNFLESMFGNLVRIQQMKSIKAKMKITTYKDKIKEEKLSKDNGQKTLDIFS